MPTSARILLTFCPIMPCGPISPRGPGSPWEKKGESAAGLVELPWLSLPHSWVSSLASVKEAAPEGRKSLLGSVGQDTRFKTLPRFELHPLTSPRSYTEVRALDLLGEWKRYSLLSQEDRRFQGSPAGQVHPAGKHSSHVRLVAASQPLASGRPRNPEQGLQPNKQGKEVFLIKSSGLSCFS